MRSALRSSFKMAPLGQVAEITLGKMLQPNAASDLDVEAPYLRAASVAENGSLDLDGLHSMWFRPGELAALALVAGDVVVVEGGSVGRSALVKEDLEGIAFQNSINRIRPKGGLDSRYLNYALVASRATGFFDVYCDSVSMRHLTAEKLRWLQIPLPRIDEQLTIADFLDCETAEIDAMIEAQRELVTGLEERKAAMSTSIIWGAAEADSGGQHVIDPAPRVPVHWQVLRNKWVYRESNELSEAGEGEMLTVSHITGITPRSEKTVNMIEAESTVGYRVVRPNDLVINTLWGWMGALGVSSLEGIVSPAYGVYRPTTSATNPVFMHHLYRSLPYVCEIQRRSTGIWSSRLRLYPKVFLDMPTVLPPRQEQDEIAVRLATAQARMDAMVDAANASIALMQERRSALISAAVTGRIDPYTGQEHPTTEEVS